MMKKIAVSILLCFLLGSGIFAGTLNAYALEAVDCKQLYENAYKDFESKHY